MTRLDHYAALLLLENRRQNLISRSTETHLWTRHLLDSLQLVRFARSGDRHWIDVGTGPGLPGIVIAALDRGTMTLVEPRARRVEFLRHVVRELALTNVSIVAGDVRSISEPADVITARAVAPVGDLLAMTSKCADARTRYILPKGRSAYADVDLARQRWQGSFHVEHSLTDPKAGIVIADRVSPR